MDTRLRECHRLRGIGKKGDWSDRARVERVAGLGDAQRLYERLRHDLPTFIMADSFRFQGREDIIYW